MDESPPLALAGWYPDAEGKQRYWDGSAWLQIDPPEALPRTPSFPENNTSKKVNRKRRRWILAVVAILALIGTGVGIQVAVVASQEKIARTEQAVKDQALKDAAAASRKAEVARKATEAQTAKEAKAAKDEVERSARVEAVSGIETSIKKMAKTHVKTDLIKGPIIDVSCVPVAGGSLDNLTEKTTVFQCFVANKRNKDETMSGYYYHATMNWGTGSYTYGFGEP